MRRLLILVGTAVFSLLGGVWLATAVAPAAPVFDGPELDYQPAIIRVQPGGDLLLIFERLSTSTLSGDLYVTRSTDDGQNWSAPQAIINTASNERHPALVQISPTSFVLIYLKDEGGNSFRIYRATSSDGLAWTEQGVVNLGWATPGEINPNLIREADGTLTMTYHRLSGPSYIAQSNDDGVTWDTLQTQVSTGSASLPRLTKREQDGLYLVTYQVNPGNNSLDMYAKVSTNPYDWSGTAVPFSTLINSHDSQPMILENGTFLVTYAQQNGAVFDLYYRLSRDGQTWTNAISITADTAHFDTQPHPLPGAAMERPYLAWSHQESATPYVDHDVWFDAGLPLPVELSASDKMVSPTVAHPEQIVTYTLRIVPDAFVPTVAVLTDTLPAATDFVTGSLTITGGSAGYDPAGRAITWTQTLTGAEPAFIQYRAIVAGGLPQGTIVSNTAVLQDGLGKQYLLPAALRIDALPQIVGTSPANGAVDVKLAAAVVISFSEPMITGTLSFTVTPDPGGWSTTWSGTDTLLRLEHDPLHHATSYLININSVEDKDGNLMDPAQWSFTTEPWRLYLPVGKRP